MIKNIFFDMDGTLLPMDTDKFVELYFQGAAGAAAPFRIDAHQLIESINTGMEAMVYNKGNRTNQEVFWECFTAMTGKEREPLEKAFDDFYADGFQIVRGSTHTDPKVKETLEALKGQHFRLVLATNPFFPASAQQQRIRWAGSGPEDFEYISSYENSHFCKPNPAYFQEILDKLGMKAEETLMVGNDAVEDVSAAKLGIRVFLITACLLHGALGKDPEGKKVDISGIPHGDFDDLAEYIRTEKER